MVHRLLSLLALVPPIVIVSTSWWWVATWRPPVDAEEQRLMGNAGRVLNGKITQIGIVAEMESLLAMNRPQVLILGNSYANTNLVPAQIADALGIPEHKVLTLSVPNSITPHWYAILKNRVYADGYRVPLVIVVGGLRSLLMVEPYSESSYEDLMIQLEPREPVLEKYLDLQHPELRQAMRNRVLLRDGLLNLIRDGAVDLFFTGGSAVTTQAMERLFDDSNVDMTRHNVSAARKVDEGDDIDMSSVPLPADGMIEDLARLAQENGTTLVFVRTPMKAITPEERRDDVTGATRREVEAIFDRYGHVFLDLYGMQLPPESYKNMRHLSPYGAQIFTEEVNVELTRQWKRRPAKGPKAKAPR